MNVRVLYFARLRERFGVTEEQLELDGQTAADLVALLQLRGGVWAEELGPGRAYRVAVNQEIVALDAVLTDNAEVAVFPPVTGG